MGGVISSLAAKFAFFPPSPPSYELKQEMRNLKMVCSAVDVTLPDNAEVSRLDTKRGTKVVALYFKNQSAKLTVLYSHGNAADLGQMFELYSKLSATLGVNLMGYDYSGYGQCSGKPSEQNTYADIEAVYWCLLQKYKVKEEDIILYGQSVGSGPTLDLASRLAKVRAIVLHSPIASGLRVMYPVKRTYWFDIYKNVDKIPLVKCPVLVIHGTADDVVDWSHGKQLWELCQDKYEPLWVRGGNHCDLEHFPQYLIHLTKFISFIELSSPLRNGSAQPADPASAPRYSTEFRDVCKPSISHIVNHRPSTDKREKPRSSMDADKRERTRKSVNLPVKETTNAALDQPEKARNSIDRFGDMIRSVGLCNIDCLKPTTSVHQR